VALSQSDKAYVGWAVIFISPHLDADFGFMEERLSPMSRR